jgi:hypothetical protein
MDEKKFKKLGFPDSMELKPNYFHLKGPFSPAIYKRLNNEELNDKELNDKEFNDKELGDEKPNNEELGDEEFK